MTPTVIAPTHTGPATSNVVLVVVNPGQSAADVLAKMARKSAKAAKKWDKLSR